jgi:hypothetical protein
VALKAASSNDKPDHLDLEKAAAIAEALHRKRELQTRLEQRETQDQEAGSSELERIRAGRDALVAWLEAPSAVRSRRLPRVARGVFLAAALVILWAAVAVHPILLLLLAPLALPLIFLSSSNQDLTWLRLGAERRFRQTGLDPSVAWEERAVRDRVSEIEDRMQAISQRMHELAEAKETEQGDREQVAAELAQAEAHLETVLTEAGLDAGDMDADFERWLGLVGQARRAREALQKVQARRKAITTKANDEREALFKFLSRQGEAPPDSRANLDALAAGLERIAARSAGQDETG